MKDVIVRGNTSNRWEQSSLMRNLVSVACRYADRSIFRGFSQGVHLTTSAVCYDLTRILSHGGRWSCEDIPATEIGRRRHGSPRVSGHVYALCRIRSTEGARNSTRFTGWRWPYGSSALWSQEERRMDLPDTIAVRIFLRHDAECEIPHPWLSV